MMVRELEQLYFLKDVRYAVPGVITLNHIYINQRCFAILIFVSNVENVAFYVCKMLIHLNKDIR